MQHHRGGAPVQTGAVRSIAGYPLKRLTEADANDVAARALKAANDRVAMAREKALRRVAATAVADVKGKPPRRERPKREELVAEVTEIKIWDGAASVAVVPLPLGCRALSAREHILLNLVCARAWDSREELAAAWYYDTRVTGGRCMNCSNTLNRVRDKLAGVGIRVPCFERRDRGRNNYFLRQLVLP